MNINIQVMNINNLTPDNILPLASLETYFLVSRFAKIQVARAIPTRIRHPLNLCTNYGHCLSLRLKKDEAWLWELDSEKLQTKTK